MALTRRQIDRNWRFIRALRSGKFVQNFGVLSKIEEDTGRICYCAQGVACEISKLGKWVVVPPFTCRDYMDRRTTAPKAVRDYYGWDMDIAGRIVNWNDTHALYFEQIADKMEAWLLKEIEQTKDELKATIASAQARLAEIEGG